MKENDYITTKANPGHLWCGYIEKLKENNAVCLMTDNDGAARKIYNINEIQLYPLEEMVKDIFNDYQVEIPKDMKILSPEFKNWLENESNGFLSSIEEIKEHPGCNDPEYDNLTSRQLYEIEELEEQAGWYAGIIERLDIELKSNSLNQAESQEEQLDRD